MGDVPSDELFQTLPSSLRRQIDDAFEHGLLEGGPRKRIKMSHHDTGGGFIPDEGGFIRDDSMHLGGGFIPDDPMESGGGFIAEPVLGGAFVPEDAIYESDTIALSSIQDSLELLGLDPDDEEILQVFRNAATGWSNADSSQAESSSLNARVSKADWRSICAVLLESRSDSADVEPGLNEDQAEVQDDEGDASDDAYEFDKVDLSEEDEEDEYTDMPVRKRGRRSTRRTRVSDDESDEGFELTPAQKRTCARDFARFFEALEETSKSITAAPQEGKSIPSSARNDSTIRIKHIQHVASLLGEKLKAEDIVEMLSAFSSAPDKMSISLADFEKIMVEAKLV